MNSNKLKIMITNKATKANKQDKKISFAIIFQFCMLITNYTIKEVFQVNNPGVRSMISLIFMILVGILYLKSIRLVLNRVGSFFVLTYASIGTLFLVTMLIYPENNEYLVEASFWLFLICLPTALYYLAIRDKTIFLDMLILSGYLQMILGFIIFISMIITTPTYDMTFSYLFLVPIVIITYKLFFVKFKFMDSILIITAIAAILTVGSRGPLLAYLIYIMLLILNYFLKRKIKIKTLAIMFIAQVSLFILVFNIYDLLILLDKLLFKYGIQSRTLYLLMSDNIDFSTGRSEIFTSTISYITQRPLLGYGIAGDRVFLNGTYPHNIFLEILAQFGVAFGGLIIAIFVIYWIKGLFFNKSKAEHHLAIVFAGIGLISLFYSGSYLNSSNYWLFMAICISSVNFRKKNIGNVNTVENSYDKGEPS